jgi:hypothetical protein
MSHLKLAGNNVMIPKEIARELKQLSLKDHRSGGSSAHQRPSSRSSSCSSSASFSSPSRPYNLMSSGAHVNSIDNEVAVIDDYDMMRSSSSSNNNNNLNNGGISESPQILATSVENSGEILLPSLSTISLLSLSREQQQQCSDAEAKRKPPSFSRSRVSSFHHHQRHPSTSIYLQNRRSSTQQQQQVAMQSPQSNTTQPININYGSGEPDTPKLGPVSLANSPSNFYLGNTQQLPASLQSRQQQQQQQQHGFPGIIRNNSGTFSTQQYHTLQQHQYQQQYQLQQQSQSQQLPQLPQLMTGNMSPVLEPVGGDGDGEGDVPMTPLLLSQPALDE